MTARKGRGALDTHSRQARSRLGMSGKERIIPNKNRRLQVAPTRRRLFGERAKAAFLERFAENCNMSLSARQIGFHYRTVIRHMREDAGFEADCEAALRLGYFRLEEAALREAGAALAGRRRPPPPRLPAGPLPRIERMDAAMALQLLREHKRAAGRAGGGPGSGRGGKPGRAPAVASGEEVMEALIKRLKAFGIRIGKDGKKL